jgi:hypothetical protein
VFTSAARLFRDLWSSGQDVICIPLNEETQKKKDFIDFHVVGIASLYGLFIDLLDYSEHVMRFCKIW